MAEWKTWVCTFGKKPLIHTFNKLAWQISEDQTFYWIKCKRLVAKRNSRSEVHIKNI